jgi:cytochrome c1
MLNTLRPVAAVLAAAVVVSVVGCASGDVSSPITGADPGRATDVANRYGCGSCHTIPGIRGADGTVGPSLAAFADRGVLAGSLPMSAANIIAWIKDPQALEPGVAMPDMDVTDQDARDIAAYLLTLHK